MNDKVLDHLVTERPAIRQRLDSFLRIPSVSADPSYAAGMEQARQFLLARLRDIGLDDARLLHGGGEPAVFASWTHAPDRPTLLVYGHYDVQPPDPLEAWTTPPFEPAERDGRIYARGASDVKASTMIALETVAAFLAVEGGCPVNIKLFIEGEEETGSPSLRGIVDRYRDLIQADAILSADGGRASAEVPTINVGARGVARFDLKLKTALKDLHSGRYGGAVRNAAHEVARLVSSLHHDDGTIAVAEFLGAAQLPSADDRKGAAAFPFDEAGFLAAVGGTAHGEAGYGTRERVTLRPSIEVNGIWGGYTGPGMKTIVPAEAHAKITMRLVAGQEPGAAVAAVQQHLRRKCPAGVELSFSPPEAGSPASSLSPGHPLVAASNVVLERLTGRRPLPVRLGATVPISAVFREMLGIETLLFGYNLPDEDIHAPNEFFRISSLHDGLTAWPMMLRELARFQKQDFQADPGMKAIRKVAIVGCGTVGSSWAALFLANGYDVSACDPGVGAEARLRRFVDRALMQLRELGRHAQGRLEFHSALSPALAGCDFIQENAPENEAAKRALLAEIDAAVPIEVIVACSTSSLLRSSIVSDCQHPERHIVAHPFNPPHLVPLVEIVGEDEAVVARASAFYRTLGQHPIVLRGEMPGHIANRLSSALYREAVHLVEQGVASVADIDAAVCYGPGLRWAIMGPHMTYHLGGGEGGIAHYLEHLGPSQQKRWAALGQPSLGPDVQARIVEGVAEEAAGRPIAQLEAERDVALIAMLRLLGRGAAAAGE